MPSPKNQAEERKLIVVKDSSTPKHPIVVTVVGRDEPSTTLTEETLDVLWWVGLVPTAHTTMLDDDEIEESIEENDADEFDEDEDDDLDDDDLDDE